MTHSEYIQGLCDGLGGVARLKTLRYEMLDGNWWKLSLAYKIEMCDIRYIDSQHKEIEKFIYEEDRRILGHGLRLIYKEVV